MRREGDLAGRATKDIIASERLKLVQDGLHTLAKLGSHKGCHRVCAFTVASLMWCRFLSCKRFHCV